MVTTSDNPRNYNGMSLLREDARPISGDTRQRDIGAPAETSVLSPVERVGFVRVGNNKSAYVRHLLSYVDQAALCPLKIVVNAGNGREGVTIDELVPHLPLEFVHIHYEPNGHFLHGIRDPLPPENCATNAEAVRARGADFGVARDGDSVAVSSSTQAAGLSTVTTWSVCLPTSSAVRGLNFGCEIVGGEQTQGLGSRLRSVLNKSCCVTS